MTDVFISPKIKTLVDHIRPFEIPRSRLNHYRSAGALIEWAGQKTFELWQSLPVDQRQEKITTWGRVWMDDRAITVPLSFAVVNGDKPDEMHVVLAPACRSWFLELERKIKCFYN